MPDNRIKVKKSQFSTDNLMLINLQNFEINRSAANDESVIFLPESVEYFSITELMKILNISTTKETEYLIKKLELDQPKYRYLNAANKWLYNNKALNLLASYIRFKAS
ncbi:hypothetical protein A9G09_04170 [Gilliamella sp. wkB292]|uniref:hypothetical protein n=1 Tax=Gilliamella sp. wkB292 TaxID=3120262 RepID=UPI00080DE80E|nr:hypothetical protein [Gilliamella apicola]OCG15552.1 hypothetical protein A9G09_04170 [Gilliamella apicola]